MKTLREHNDDRGSGGEKSLDLKTAASGVACEKCGTEMLFDTPRIMSSGAPASLRVTCPNCSSHGRKLV